MLTVAEYFAGIGLVRLGLEAAGWHIIFANDVSQRKYAMYQSAFPDSKTHYHVKDIFDLDVCEIPQTILATCSFPCTDLSLAGNFEGLAGKHSSAFWGFIQALGTQGDCAPEIILLENVNRWLHSNNGHDFRLTIQALNQLGYRCDVFTLDAVHFTPQSRLCVFVIGSRITLPAVGIDPFLARGRQLASNRLKKAVAANSDLQWMWLPIPEPPSFLTAGLSSLIEDMDDADPRWWSAEQVERHLGMMAEQHSTYVQKLESSFFVSYRTVFRRMRHGKQRAEVRNDDLSGCLRTVSGGSARQIVLKAGLGKVQMRHMTSREYARLQGVPDSYPITVSENDVLTGFGDAVCVPLISWIARNVLAYVVTVPIGL